MIFFINLNCKFTVSWQKLENNNTYVFMLHWKKLQLLENIIVSELCKYKCNI